MKTEDHLEKATFGGGCFWCTEAIFNRIQGVIHVVSGYSGGTTSNPTYQEVCSGKTGHAEVVQITFDPKTIDYKNLLEIFWLTHDPTTLNQQGADIGTQYRSIILYHDEGQKKTAELTKAELQNSGRWNASIVTEIVKLDHFYPAEEYHWDYFRRNPQQPYCLFTIAPKVLKAEGKFKDLLK
jgi:peptide-methionine (S)-S-oxide reductase